MSLTLWSGNPQKIWIHLVISQDQSNVNHWNWIRKPDLQLRTCVLHFQLHRCTLKVLKGKPIDSSSISWWISSTRKCRGMDAKALRWRGLCIPAIPERLWKTVFYGRCKLRKLFTAEKHCMPIKRAPKNNAPQPLWLFLCCEILHVALPGYSVTLRALHEHRDARPLQLMHLLGRFRK